MSIRYPNITGARFVIFDEPDDPRNVISYSVMKQICSGNDTIYCRDIDYLRKNILNFDIKTYMIYRDVMKNMVKASCEFRYRYGNGGYLECELEYNNILFSI